MRSHAQRLPDRFPDGTRYVVEGRGTDDGLFLVNSRYVELPDGRRIALPEVPEPVRLRWRRRPATASNRWSPKGKK